MNGFWGTQRGGQLSGAMLCLAAVLFVAPTASARKVTVRDAAAEKSIADDGGRLVADYGSFRLYEADRVRSDLMRKGKVEIRGDYNSIFLNAGRIDTATAAAKALVGSVETFAGKHLHLIQFAGAVQPAWREALKNTGVRIVAYIPQNAYLVYGDAQSIAKLQSLAGSAASVQWNGQYQDDFKIHPDARLVDEKGNARQLATNMFAIQLVEDTDANPATLALIDQLRLEPIRRKYSLLQCVNVFVRLRPQDLSTVAARPDLISIQPYTEPRRLDERQDQIVAGNLSGNSPSGPGYLTWLAGKGFTQGQFTASGFAVDISDSGIDDGTTAPGHFGLYVSGDTNNASRVIYSRLEGRANSGSTLQGCDGHGTINAHIVCGYDGQPDSFPHTDSEGYYYGLGVCPFVNVGCSAVFDPLNFTNPNYPDLISEAYHDSARISNNSWGEKAAGAYTSDSQAYDALVRDAQPDGSTYSVMDNQEMVIVFAAGNDGPSSQSMDAPGTAKNVITVGAAENVRSMTPTNGGNDSSGNDGCGLSNAEADNANDIYGSSSRGPCSDGRIKPDLVAPGTHITGGAPQTYPPPSPSGTGSALSCFLSIGNSIGICGLPGSGTIGMSNFFPVGQQFFTESSGTSHATPCVAGACALLRQYFINQSLQPPSPAMTKAYLMNSARYMTGASANDTLWSDNQGMGELDLGLAFDGASRVLRDELDADRFTATGQTRVFFGTVGDPAKPFRVTLAWTDAPGSTTGHAYNNDLDLTVTIGGRTYKGNVFSGAYSTTGGSADHQNNVESVFLPAGVSGPFTITITATSINSDGVPNNGDPLDQDFALVAYNGVQMPSPIIVVEDAALTAESCTPANGVIDPGETVTVNFSLANVGDANATNLVVTLLATGGVTSPPGPQTYGVLSTNGVAMAKPFTFKASGECGAAITNTFQVQDGGTSLGTVAFVMTLGETKSDFSGDFDAVTAPALPSGWATSSSGGQSTWVTLTGAAYSSPNAAFSPDPGSAGVNELDTPAIAVETASAQLTFHQSYDLEASSIHPTVAYDGGVLEIKIGSRSYEDILTARGSFVTGGYDHTISRSYDNPLAGRQAWSGDSSGFVTTIVNLPASAAGKNIRLRWRCGTDSGNSRSMGGWHVDDITISESVCCSASISDRFAAEAGTYQGLVQSNSPSPQTSGFITITVAARGTFSARLTFDGTLYSFSGSFDTNGVATALITRSSGNALTVALQLDLTNGSKQITGTVSGGSVTSDLTANLASGSSSNGSASTFRGYYTVLLPAGSGDTNADIPQGIGYGTLRVDAHGKARFKGVSGDGTIIKQNAVISENGAWPVYIPLYAKQGLLSGWVTFTNIVGVSDLGGTLSWIKPAGLSGRYYVGGFSTNLALQGAQYVVPPAGTAALAVTNAACNLLAILGGGNLNSLLTNPVTLGATGRIASCVTNGLRLKIASNTGLFSGSFKNPVTGKSAAIRGVLLQRPNMGGGLFLGTNQTGFVSLTPSP